MQIVGRHEQFDVGRGPADVQIAGPPTFGRHIDKAVQFDLLRIVGKGLEGKAAVLIEIFQAALDDKGVISQRQFEENMAREDKMILPEGCFIDLAGLIVVGAGEVHAAGDRFARIFVDDG